MVSESKFHVIFEPPTKPIKLYIAGDDAKRQNLHIEVMIFNASLLSARRSLILPLQYFVGICVCIYLLTSLSISPSERTQFWFLWLYWIERRCNHGWWSDVRDECAERLGNWTSTAEGKLDLGRILDEPHALEISYSKKECWMVQLWEALEQSWNVRLSGRGSLLWEGKKETYAMQSRWRKRRRSAQAWGSIKAMFTGR